MTVTQTKIIKGLILKGNYGYLTIRTAFIPATVFYVVRNGAHYKINQLIKTTGFGYHEVEISRCDTQISEFDQTILTEGTIIKILNTPTGKIKPAYNL